MYLDILLVENSPGDVRLTQEVFPRSQYVHTGVRAGFHRDLAQQ